MMFYTPSQKRSQKAQEEILSTENHEIAGFPVFQKKTHISKYVRFYYFCLNRHQTVDFVKCIGKKTGKGRI